MTYFRTLQNLARTPQGLVLLITLALMIAALCTQFIFAPLFVAGSAVIIFFGVAFIMVQNFIRLTTLSHDTTHTTYEFQTLVENLDDGIVIYDPSFTIFTLNRAAERIFSISAGDVDRKSVV